MFPYIPVDRIHESGPHTGCKTILRAGPQGRQVAWEPFNREHDGRFRTSRNVYKSVLGHKLRFEELNHDLGLAFRYTWATSDRYGFVRRCELENLRDEPSAVELVDGLQNILPAGMPGFVQASASNLVNAYKWTELDPGSGLAMYALYSGISDRAEPCESLRANGVYGLGLDAPAHVGHFRNACLGDSLARLLRRVGHHVEVQNYIDDTGVQVADIVVGLNLLGMPASGAGSFDRHCSEVYAAVQQAYSERPDLLEHRAEAQRAIETGHGALAASARDVTRRIAEANLATMHRAAVSYDLLTWESHILALGFWQHAFEKLRASGAIRREETGPHAGCWVLPYGHPQPCYGFWIGTTLVRIPWCRPTWTGGRHARTCFTYADADGDGRR